MNQDDDPGVVEQPARHPGRELGAARERAGISLEEMAATLHLPVEQVRAVESDDYERLPPPAYVRGYLRAYAREVGMDADQVVADYDAVCGEAGEPELVVHAGVPDPAAGRRPLLALLIVIAVVLAGALAWWLQQSTDAPVMASGNGEAESVPSGAGGATQDEKEVDNAPEPAGDADEPTAPEAPEAAAATQGDDGGRVTGDAETATMTAAAEDGPAEIGDSPQAYARDAGDAGDESVDEVVAATTEEAGPAEQAQETEETRETEETAETEEEPVPESMLAEGSRPTATARAEEVATIAAAEGPDRLRIEIDGESWLEVFDARGRQLAYTLYSGDEPVVLRGWAPFDVFLGNAPDVSLRFGDLEIDHSAFVRSDNTARFVVDAEGAGRR